MDPEIANGWIEAMAAPWLGRLGIRVDKMACTGAVLTMEVSPEITEPDGVVAPQAVVALADVAMRIACAGHFRDDRPVSRTGLDVQFLQTARGERLVCTATVVRGSKSLVFTRAVTTAEPSGREIAATTATWLVTAAR